MDCIIITSVVQVSDKPLNYSKTRSIYSHKQRFEQTLLTIESIRKYMPYTDIILVECSAQSQYMDDLSKKVEYFYNLEFNDIIVNGLEKGKGEATLLLHAISKLEKTYNNIFKISGRYILQGSFDINKWKTTNNITACKTTDYGTHASDYGIHTSFYKIPMRCILELKEVFHKYLLENDISIEIFLGRNLTNITCIDHIGILAPLACYNITPII